MDLRLVEVVLPAETTSAADALIGDTTNLEAWHEPISDGRILLRVLVSAGGTEAVMDRIQSAFGHVDGFRIIVFPVAASIPAPSVGREEEVEEDVVEGARGTAGSAVSGASADSVPVGRAGPGRDALPKSAGVAGGRATVDADAEADGDADADADGAEAAARKADEPLHRISRAELHAAVSGSVNVTYVFILMVALSSVVAALGILGDNVAIVIGAMVIAPLLGPNVALSMATTLADADLGKRAMRANVVGAVVAFAVALGIGLVVPVDPEVGELASRTRVGLADMALALAAGSAGALAFTSGVSATLIGVMVAVALLPPVVVFGLLLGSGHGGLAGGALLLVLTNVICINLAGVATFLVQGIRPLDWWDAERAKKATRVALLVWLGLLAALVVVIRIAQRGWEAAL